MEEKIFSIQKWLGVNQAGDGDTNLKTGEAAEMTNWRVTDDGALKKRPGTKEICGFPGEINGAWHGYVAGAECTVVSAGGKLYRVDLADGTAAELGAVANAHTEFFGFATKLYLLNGSEYKVYDGEALRDVQGYVPLVLIAVGPSGAGTIYEQVNRLTKRRRIRLSPDGTAATFQLPETAATVVRVTELASGDDLESGADYQVQGNAVVFSSAPAAGSSTYEVEYTVADGFSASVHAMRYAEIYNGTTDNRVFLYGDGSNRALYSGLDGDGNPTAEYFPDMNVLNIGDENTPITALIRHYSRMIAYKLDSAYAVQYGTVTTEEGKLIPAFYWTPINRALGNCAPGQVRLVDNNPLTLHNSAVYQWRNSGGYSSNLTVDERQARRVSDRVWRALGTMDLRAAYCYDDNERKEWYCICGERAAVWNYGLNVWYLYDRFGVREMFAAGGTLYGARGSRLVEISSEYRSDCGMAFSARWESGNMHFGADYMRKYSAMLWLGVQPTYSGALTVTITTDRKADFSKKIVYRNVSTFEHANFAHWTFNTSHRPYMTRLKLKAKKFTYYKLILTNDDADTAATVTSADVRVRYTGYVR